MSATCSSNSFQKNLPSTYTVSSSPLTSAPINISTTFPAVLSSNSPYPLNSLQQNHPMYPPGYPESLQNPAFFNQNLPIVTNPYSNFPINVSSNAFQNNSCITTQSIKHATDKNSIPTPSQETISNLPQGKSEKILYIPQSKPENVSAPFKSENNITYTTNSTLVYIPQTKYSNATYVAPLKAENIPHLSKPKSQLNVAQQQKSENIAPIAQLKLENTVNYAFQPKSEKLSYIAPPLKTTATAYAMQLKSSSTPIPYSLELQKSVPNTTIEDSKICVQSQITTSTNLNYPKPTSSSAASVTSTNSTVTTSTIAFHTNNKHLQMYSPYQLPSNNVTSASTSITEFYPTSISNIQNSSTTNLPPNCTSIYPPVIRNPSEFISSAYCPSTFPRTAIPNTLSTYHLAKSTPNSGFLLPNTFSSTSTTNHLPIYSSASSIAASFAASTNAATSSGGLLQTVQSPNVKDNFLTSQYSSVSSLTTNSNYLTSSTSNVIGNSSISQKQGSSTSSSIYYPSISASSTTSNVIYSLTTSNLTSISTSHPKQTSKTTLAISSSNNIQTPITKDTFSSSANPVVFSSSVSNNARQTASFKSYQPSVQTTLVNSQKSHINQQQSNGTSISNTTQAPLLPQTQYTSSSQNNLISKSTSGTLNPQNSLSNSNAFSSSYSTSSSFTIPVTQSKSKTPITYTAPSSIDIGSVYPQVSSGYNKFVTNYPPQSITPLPAPLLSTTLPITSTSLPNFHQNSGLSTTFVEPIDTLKYSVPSSVAPIQNYSRANPESSATMQSKSLNSKTLDSFISTIPPTPIYTHASQTNLNYCAANTFYPCGSDAIYSPAKNYYYHPLQMQDTPNFSFSLTSTTNALSTASPNNSTITTQPYSSSVKPEIAWMPPPPPPSITSNNYKSSFTFSLTPTTATTCTSAVNCSTNNPTSRSISNLSSTQKGSSTKSTAGSKTKTNYNNTSSSDASKHGSNKIQPSTSTNVAITSNFATNFTFSLTQSKTSITESSVFGKPATDFSQQKHQHQQQQQQIFDRHGINAVDQQHKQNTSSATNFSFALTKTTNSSNPVPTGTSVQRTISAASSSAIATTTTSSSSFTIDATLNQSNYYTTSNSNNLKSSSMVPSDQTQNSGVFKKPLLEPSPIKGSSASLSNQSTMQSYYQTYDQRLQRPPQPSTPALHQKVNWMAPSEFGAPPLIDYACVPSYPTAQIAPQTFDYNNRKNDLYYPSFATNDDNFPSWSPNKMLDTTPHFASTSTTLGNYYNDISSFNSSGNSSSFPTSSIQTIDSNKSSYSTNQQSNSNKTVSTIGKDYKETGTNASSCTQSNNFFSVSQLVDQESNTTSQKTYDDCTNNNGSASNSNNSNKKASSSSSSSKSKDSKKFNTNNNTTYSPAIEHSANNANAANVPVATSNSYSTEAILTKKEKTIRNFANVCNPDFYGSMNAPPNTLYPSASSSVSVPPSSSLIPDNMDSSYFYNYPANTGGCLPETDYLGSIYSSESNYVRSPSIKSVRKLPTSAPPIPPSTPHQSHHPIPHHPPASSNFVPYDANYYPVSLGVNSPLMPGPAAPPPPPPTPHHHHHMSSDPYGVPPPPPATPHPYIHPSASSFQAHAWSSKPSYNLQDGQQQQQHHHHHQQQQQSHLFSSEINVNPSNGMNSSNSSVQSNTTRQNTSNNGNQDAAAAGGNNLTNFNLTTICPEINNEKVGSNPW